MDTFSIITIIISILSSSIFTLIISSIFLDPFKDKKKYIFDEKKRVYESIIIFAQIVLYPKESKYSLGVERYNIQELTEEQSVKNALNDLKMAIPKIQLITNNQKVVLLIKNFISSQDESTFNLLVNVLNKDLYR